MSQTAQTAVAVAVIGIDIGKNSFHIVGHDERGAIVLRQKWSRGQVEARLAGWFSAGMQTSEIKAKLIAQGLYPVGTCGAEFGAFIRKKK